jgi:hypothetical protein
LKQAQVNGQLIRLNRRFERTHIRGYVLDIGPQFFLLALVSDRIWFDGFECFRLRDVLNVASDPFAAFAEAAPRKRRQRTPKNPGVDVSSPEALLLSVGRRFPLIAVHREQVDPEVCWIGCVLGVHRGRLSLLEINPDAKWDVTPTEHSVKEITRVNFGGDYEEALASVGGEPNPIRTSPRNSLSH